MAHIQGEVLIRRPVEEVFDYVADQRNEPTYNRNMVSSEMTTEGPIEMGTRFRATIRGRSRPIAMDIEYTRFERPHLIASTTRMSTADFAGTLTFTPTSAGTRLRWSWDARPKGLTRLRWSWDARPKGLTRLLAPLFTLIGARQERRMWTALRDHLEADARPTSTASVRRAAIGQAHR